MNLGRAQHLMTLGRFEEATSALDLPEEGLPADSRAQLTLARILEARGDLSGALATLDRLRAQRDEYAPGHLFYGILACDSGNAAAGLTAFDRVLELQPDNDVARSYRALALLQAGRDVEAVEIFRDRGFSDNRMYRVRLTEWMEQEWLKAERFFGQRPLFSDEESVNFLPVPQGRIARESRESKALSLYQRKQYTEVVRHLETLSREEQPDEGVLFSCAFASEMCHDHARALCYLERLPQNTETWPSPLLAARGRVYVRLRRFREAVEDLNRVEMVGPEDFGANYYFAVICLAAGDRPQARRLFLRAHTQYLIDTLEFQWWQIERALLGS